MKTTDRPRSVLLRGWLGSVPGGHRPQSRCPGGSPAEAGFDPSHPSRQQNQEEGFSRSRPTFHQPSPRQAVQQPFVYVPAEPGHFEEISSVKISTRPRKKRRRSFFSQVFDLNCRVCSSSGRRYESLVRRMLLAPAFNWRAMSLCSGRHLFVLPTQEPRKEPVWSCSHPSSICARFSRCSWCSSRFAGSWASA